MINGMGTINKQLNECMLRYQAYNNLQSHTPGLQVVGRDIHDAPFYTAAM